MIEIKVASEFMPQAIELMQDPAFIQRIVADIATAARAKWISLAGQNLHTSRRDYVSGIQEVKTRKRSASVSLTGRFPNMIEEGLDPFDMHDTHLSLFSPGVHMTEDGARYRAIPFRHQTPGTLGVGGGVPMDHPYKGHPLVTNAAELGKEVYGLAQKLEKTQRKRGGGTRWGGRLPGGLAPKLRPHHTTDIFAGMVRQEKRAKGGSRQSTYTTFRTISDNAPEKWLHPGIQPANLADQVSQYVDKIAPMAFAAAFET